MTVPRIERLRRAVLRHSHRDLDLAEFRAVLDESLRSVLDYDVAAWSTVGPATLLFTSCALMGAAVDTQREAALFDLEFAIDDVNQFVVLAVSDPAVATLGAAIDGDITRSTRWVELLRRSASSTSSEPRFSTSDHHPTRACSARRQGRLASSQSAVATEPRRGSVRLQQAGAPSNRNVQLPPANVGTRNQASRTLGQMSTCGSPPP